MTTPIKGVFERRGKWRKWKQVGLILSGNSLTEIRPEDIHASQAHPVDMRVVRRVEAAAGLEFVIHVTARSNSAMEKWHMKAANQGDFDSWIAGINKALAPAGAAAGAGAIGGAVAAGAGAIGAPPPPPMDDGSPQSFGLPPCDPRSDLPFVSVPPAWLQAFKFLQTTVIHWFCPIKILNSTYENEEMIGVLGDRCVYICSPTADVKRCVRVPDIKKVLVAQDSKKELYVILQVAPWITVEGKTEQLPEHDIMFHSWDIKRFVRFLRTVYIHQTHGMLPLEQLSGPEQLENEVRLAAAPNWTLNYWQPMMKEHLKKILDMWEKSTKYEENQAFKQKVAEMFAAQQGGVENELPPPPPDAPQGAQAGGVAAPLAGGAAAYGAVAGGGIQELVGGAAPALGGGAAPALGGGGAHVDPVVAGGVGARAAPVEEEESDEEDDYPEEAEENPFGRLLIAEGLGRYYTPLVEKNNLNLELLESGLVDDSDLKHWGVPKDSHRARIISLGQEADMISAARKGDEIPSRRRKKGAGGDDEEDDLPDELPADYAAAATSPADCQQLEATKRQAMVAAEVSCREDVETAWCAFSPEAQECDTSEPLGRFLKLIKLPHYYTFLSSRNVTLDTLCSGLIDDNSLKLFGITNKKHRGMILRGLKNKALTRDYEGDDWLKQGGDQKGACERAEGAKRRELKGEEATARNALMKKFEDTQPAPQDVDMSDPLARFLVAVGIPQYYWGLCEREMSLDVMTCGLVDEDDLKNHCDIQNPIDRKKIKIALKDQDLIDAAERGDKMAKGSWSITASAQKNLAAAQSKIKDLGGLELDLGEGFGKPSSAPKAGKPAAKPAAAAPAAADAGDLSLDDLDLDLDAPAKPAAGGDPADVSLGDLSLGDAPAKGGGDDLDLDLDLDDVGDAKPAAGGDDLDLDLDL